jgi:hypothetical protein
VKTILIISAFLPLALAGCANSGGMAWGEQAGGGASQMAQAGAASGATVRTGSISADLASATGVIIAEHPATPHQVKVAQQRGRAWIKHAGTTTAAAAPHRHRYIAIDTEPDGNTSPAAKKTVMIFDTQAQQVVGGNVYDVQTAPPVGSVARFETYSAQYVGPGN